MISYHKTTQLKTRNYHTVNIVINNLSTKCDYFRVSIKQKKATSIRCRFGFIRAMLFSHSLPDRFDCEIRVRHQMHRVK